MKLIMLKFTDPYYNLAVEEYLFLHSEDDIFMLWQNEKTVVIGKNQNTYAELDVDYARRQGISIARRITGGGAVYHDMGNLNYTYISTKKEQNGIDFAFFCAPIIDFLRSMGVDAALSGRNDILVNGRKISGNAQYSANGRVLHHGTLLYDSDTSVLSSVLRADEEKLKAKAIRSVSSRVMNLREILPLEGGVGELAEKIMASLMEKFGGELTEAPRNGEIDALTLRNGSDDWIFPKRAFLSKYTVTNKKRYPFGSVEITLQMSGEIIENVRICGDFFGNEPIDRLEELISEVRHSEVKSRLEGVEVGRYISGMTEIEFTRLVSDALSDSTREI
jgi:lipoate-protein ligase A